MKRKKKSRPAPAKRKRRAPKSRTARTRGRWALVRVRDGLALLAWLDGSTWNGWADPWFPDASMDALGDSYFGEEFEERAPHVEHSGVYSIQDEDGRVVELDRVRMKCAGTDVALTDAEPMRWCWEEVPAQPETLRDAMTRAGIVR